MCLVIPNQSISINLNIVFQSYSIVWCGNDSHAVFHLDLEDRVPPPSSSKVLNPNIFTNNNRPCIYSVHSLLPFMEMVCIYYNYDENLETDLRNNGRNHGSIKLLWVTFQIVKSLKYSTHNNYSLKK